MRRHVGLEAVAGCSPPVSACVRDDTGPQVGNHALCGIGLIEADAVTVGTRWVGVFGICAPVKVIDAGAAAKVVIAVVTVQLVVAAIAAQRIVPRAAVNDIVTASALDQVIAVVAVDDVGAAG